MLRDPLGVYLYNLLPHDKAWNRLSPEERALVLDNNRRTNVFRDDYANPEKYGTERIDGGEIWDSPQSREAKLRGRVLRKTLDELKPASVLEIGPGPGFYSKLICEHTAVQRYVAIDINPSFIRYLGEKIGALGLKRRLDSELIVGAIEDIQLNGKVDLIVMLSCVHHLPLRTELFQKLHDCLNPGGRIFAFDPSHYLVRWAELSYKYLKKKAYSEKYWGVTTRWGTHHFCTIGEYRRILNELPGLELEREFYSHPRKLQAVPGLTRLFPRLLSTEMGVLIKRT